MRHVLKHLLSSLQQGHGVVLAAILQSTGSVPRSSGARMLVRSDGFLAGSIGGGPPEATCIQAARDLLNSPETWADLDFTLDNTAAADKGMICGGVVRVLLHKVEPEQLPFFTSLYRQYTAHQRPLLLTSLPTGETPLELSIVGPEPWNPPEDELLDQLLTTAKGVPFHLDYGATSLFIEPLVHPGTVHLAGGGHVALATAHLATYAGFEVVVMDDRPEFASAERFPMASEVKVLEGFHQCFSPSLGMDDYVVIVTRGHSHDRDVLAQALKTQAGYIGMIGSTKKKKSTFAALMAQGFTEEDLQRVHCPIGLPISADTPEEIGFSILAELIKARAGSLA